MSRNPDLTFFIHTQNTPLTDCATAGLCIESANVVGYQAKSVTANTRAIRSAATFLLVGENPTAIKLSDIKQTAGEPVDLTLCTYALHLQ